MVISPARPEDVTQLAELAAELGYPVSASEATAYLARIIPSPDHTVLVAQAEGGQLVGWIHGFVARRLFVPEFAELGGLVVSGPNRRLGVASQLLDRVEEWAAQVGCPVIRIRSNSQRHDADAFYRRSSYIAAKTQTVFEKRLEPRSARPTTR